MDKWLEPARQSVPQSEWQHAYASGAGLTPQDAIALVRAVGAHDRQ